MAKTFYLFLLAFSGLQLQPQLFAHILGDRLLLQNQRKGQIDFWKLSTIEIGTRKGEKGDTDKKTERQRVIV